MLSNQNRNDRMFRIYRIQDLRRDTNPAKSHGTVTLWTMKITR